MSSNLPDDWGPRKRRVLERDRWRCQVCGRKGGPRGDAQLHVHHIVHRSEGGGHELDNLTTLCDLCHAEYHNDPRLVADRGKDNTLWAHAKVAALTGWWTGGLGNLVFEGKRRWNEHRKKNQSKRRAKGTKALEKRRRKRKAEAKKGWGITALGIQNFDKYFKEVDQEENDFEDFREFFKRENSKSTADWIGRIIGGIVGGSIFLSPLLFGVASGGFGSGLIVGTILLLLVLITVGIPFTFISMIAGILAWVMVYGAILVLSYLWGFGMELLQKYHNRHER